jgi:glycerol kinase
MSILRETSGQPVYNAVVWQRRHSTPQCERLVEQGLASEIRDRTGLVIDVYFSPSKLPWLFERPPGLRQHAIRGERYFGTVDSRLVYRMTSRQLLATDVSNASRTMLDN